MKLLNYIKNLIKVENNNLSFLNIGDIIWARRYETEEERQKIKVGHQESPYVIIKKTNNKVYGLQCTSNPHQEVKWKMLLYPLGRLNYNMEKNSYISCLKVYELKEIQFVEIINHLNEYDLNQLKKQLYILVNSNFKLKPDIEEKYLKFNYTIGDIILQNNIKYYIYSIEDKYYNVYRLKQRIKKNRNILINNTYYSFIFNKPEKIKIKSKYTLIDTFNTGEIELINNYKNKVLEEINNKVYNRELKIGTIIDYKNNMYYIYNIEEKIYAYRVYSNSIKKNKITEILVNGGIYKTFFSSIVIDKEILINNGYKIRRFASKEEIEYNTNIFNSPINQRKKMTKKISCLNKRSIKDFIPMTILKNMNTNKYYLIIDKKDNIIELVNINDMKDIFYFQLEEFNCPFEYYRILSKEEYNTYIDKINELKEIANMFNK